MTLDALLAGVAAIISAALGVVLVVREFRRRDRRESLAEINAMSAELHDLRLDTIAYRQWAYDVAVVLTDRGIATVLTDQGIVVPPFPAPTVRE